MQRIGMLLLVGLLGAGCPSRPVAEVPDTTGDLAALDAAARRGAVTETIFGVQVEDPYRALEEDSPETWAR